MSRARPPPGGGSPIDRLVAARDRVVPLLPRRPVAGLPGGMRSSRRGQGVDLAGSRPYRPGDDVRLIDRHASARRPAWGGDELVVREHLTEQAARVGIVLDRGPTMSLFPPGLPWLSKPAAVAEACGLLGESAAALRSTVEIVHADPSAGSRDRLAGAVRALLERRRGLDGSFLFVVSDFLEALPESAFAAALAGRVDLVPVVVQDPTWEQSFPAVGGTLLPLADPATGRPRHMVLSRAEAEERRAANAKRLVAIRRRLSSLGLDLVLLSDHRPAAVRAAFAAWAEGRRARGRLR